MGFRAQEKNGDDKTIAIVSLNASIKRDNYE